MVKSVRKDSSSSTSLFSMGMFCRRVRVRVAHMPRQEEQQGGLGQCNDAAAGSRARQQTCCDMQSTLCTMLVPLVHQPACVMMMPAQLACGATALIKAVA